MRSTSLAAAGTALLLSTLATSAHAQTETWATTTTQSASDFATLALDGQGDVYYRAPHGTPTIEKFDPDSGAPMWTATYPVGAGETALFPSDQSLVVASDGNLFIGGTVRLVSGNDVTRVTRVAAATGAVLGTWDYAQAGHAFTRFQGLTRDSLGRVVLLTSTYLGNTTTSVVTVRALATNGTPLWATSTNSNLATSIAPGLDGDVLVGTYWSGTVLRYDANGAFKWGKALCTTFGTDCEVHGLAIDAAGNPMAAARTGGQAIARKFKRSNGATTWTSTLAMGGAYAVLIGGDFVVQGSAVIKRLSAATGATLWTHTASAAIRGVAATATGDIALLVGTNVNTITFATGAQLSSFAPSGMTALTKIVVDVLSERGFVHGVSGPQQGRLVAFD